MRAGAMIRDRVVLFAIGAGLFGGRPAVRSNVPPQQKSDQKAENPRDQREAANFSDADAARVLDGLRQALESNNERRLLKLFDAARMPDYPAFRDQVAQFFDEYEAFQVHYHITQVSTEGRVGVATADFELEATPSRATSPNVRRNVQLRLVLAWDGKQWRMIDLAPRGLFR